MCSGASKCNDGYIYKISVINTTPGYTFHYFKNIKSKVMPSHAKSLLTEIHERFRRLIRDEGIFFLLKIFKVRIFRVSKASPEGGARPDDTVGRGLEGATSY